MAYQSLYRRYRPRRFSDVRGQDHVVPALRNAVREERVGHAYLFSGPRGTGKTSTARILAKALNCPDLADGEPCGVCESCLAIDAGTSYDVQELDAASNNGVESIRELVARAALGSPGRTKVYILDEVHMLTAAASAALLKTLEEPPGHVVFVLATTDPEKVLPTIRSRTQHYRFHLLSAEVLAEHVAWVMHDAGLDLADDVIGHVVRQAQGSARDALSALDQVAAAGGVLDRGDALDDLLDAIAAGDAPGALVAVSSAVSDGRDPRVLGEAVLARLRDVFLVRMGAATDHLPEGDVARVQAWADQLGDRATTRALEAVGDALLEMRQAPDPRIPLDVAMVKLTRVDADPSIVALAARVAALEAALAARPQVTAPAATAPPTRTPSVPDGSIPSAPTIPTPAAAAPRVEPSAPEPERSRPADGARAALASKRVAGQRASTAPSGRGSPPAAPVPPPATPGAKTGTDSSTAPTGGEDHQEAASSAAVDPGAAQPGGPPVASDASPPPGTGSDAPTTATASSPAPAPPTGPGTVSTAEQVAAVWESAVLPSLGGLAKAMYAAGHIAEVDGSTVVFALPNDVHRQKCERKRDEVERALSDRMGQPITLRLTVDAEGADAQASDSGAGHAVTSADAEPDEDLAIQEVHDLEDAPDAQTGGIDALTEAFPGSELVEES